MTTRTAACLALVAATTCLAPRARADAPARPGLEAITQDAARRAAESIACASPKARLHLAGTMGDLAERRWGLLPASLRVESIELAAEAVYEAATRGDASGDALLRFLGDARAAACGPRELAAARRALAGADAPGRTGLDRCSGQRLADRRNDPACALALAARAAMGGDHEEARAHVADLVASASFATIYDGKPLPEREAAALYEGVSAALQEVMLAGDGDETIDEEVARAFSGIDLDEVDPARCKDGDLLRDLAEGVLDSQDGFCSATRADLDPEKVPVALTGPSGGVEKTNLAGLVHVTSAFEHARDADQSPRPSEDQGDERVAEALLCALPLAPPDRNVADCASGVLVSKQQGTFKLTVGDHAWTIAVSGKGAATRLAVSSPDHVGLAALVLGTSQALHVRYDASALIKERLLVEPPRPAALRDLARAALRLRETARALDDVDAESGRFGYLVGVVDALPRVAPRSAAGAGMPAAAPCTSPQTALDRARCAAGGAARALLVAAQDGRRRDLAARVTTLLQPARPELSCWRASSSQLLTAFASYVDDGDASDPGARELSTEQLRAAARDVAACAEGGDADRAPRALDLLPSPALRASWNGAYRNAWGSDGFRVVPSLDVLTARVRLTPRSAPVAVGVQASLVDLLAPFTELAMRNPDLDYDRQGALWLELLRPRVEATFAPAALARHVVFVGGVSMRTAAPFVGAVDPSAPKPDTSATYLTPLSSAPARSERFGSFVEASVGIKYVF